MCLKNELGKKVTFEPQNILKKQEAKSENLTSAQSGWRRLAILEF